MREILEVQVNQKGIDVYLKDGSVHNYPIDIDIDPVVATWEHIRNYKPLEDEIVLKKPKSKAKPRPKTRKEELVIPVFDDDTSIHRDDPDPFD